MHVLVQNQFFCTALNQIKGTFVVYIRIVFINYLDSYFVGKYLFYSFGILSD